MGYYGPASILVDRLIARAGSLSIDEAFDIYRAHGARVLLKGAAAEREALLQARRAARTARLHPEYEAARQAAATSWRRGLPETQGPWLMVGSAIANAAGALVVEAGLDEDPFQLLIGPWRQAIGPLVPVGPGNGPGTGRRERIRAIDRRATHDPASTRTDLARR
ncbi:MAG: hypothetical protein ACRDG7_01330 [Candidatus Limnocylindria bacterium]